MRGTPDKRALLEALRTELSSELERGTRRAHEAAEAATHEENRPEGDKDMRSTEASYVARGIAERVRELEQSLAKLASVTLRDFGEGDAISVSALVDVEHEAPPSARLHGKKSHTTYFLVPAGGGVRLHVDGEEVLTLATTSPLGAALLGLSPGDEAEVSTPHGTKSYDVVGVR